MMTKMVSCLMAASVLAMSLALAVANASSGSLFPG